VRDISLLWYAYQLWSEASYISVHRGSERACELRLGASVGQLRWKKLPLI
jgi:hypothetical protein